MFKITEQANPHGLEVVAMKMSTDDCGHKVAPPLQKSNFYYILSGGPRSGKTNLLLNLIKKKNCFYYRQFNKIYIFSNSFHTIKEKLSLPPENIINGLDMGVLQNIIESEQEEYQEDLAEDIAPSKILFIFDDVITTVQKNMKEMLKLCFNRRHIAGGASVIITTQKYNKVPLELRTCATGIFFFNTKNKEEISTLHKELINLDKNAFIEVLEYVFDRPHNFLYLNLENNNDNMMFKNFNKIVIEDPSKKFLVDFSTKELPKET